MYVYEIVSFIGAGYCGGVAWFGEEGRGRVLDMICMFVCLFVYYRSSDR